MKPGDVFIYQGPAWDEDARGPEFFDLGTARLQAREVYQHFIVAVDTADPLSIRYIVPRVFVKTGEELL